MLPQFEHHVQENCFVKKVGTLMVIQFHLRMGETKKTNIFRIFSDIKVYLVHDTKEFFLLYDILFLLSITKIV